MHIFLTYLLASLAVSVLDLVALAMDILLVLSSASLLGEGDPDLMAGQISDAVLQAIIAILGAAIFMSAAWLLVGKLASMVGRPFSGRTLLIRGVISSAVVSLAFGAVELILFGLTPGSGDAALSVVFVIAIGLVWGAVFWLRQPKASNVGHTA